MNSEPSRAVLFRIAGALMLLLALTVGLSFVDLGRFNLIAALAIATLKAVLVILFFMEVRYSGRATQLIAGAGLLWLALLIVGTMLDVITRHPILLPMGG
jgi:cytochrome c oxidase subunit 4